jgi:hypothetical protein
MSQEWADIIKYFGTIFAVLTVAYKGFTKWVDAIKDRPPSDESTPKMLAAILQKITDSLDRDAVARLGRMENISSVLERLASLQAGIADSSLKSQTNTDTLHRMTRDRIDQLGGVVGPSLSRIEQNQMTINTTIQSSFDQLAGTLSGKKAA